MESHPAPAVVPARRPGLVWIVPLLALVIGAYVVQRELLDKGPRITIDFGNGAGIAVDQTKLVYKGIVIGFVTGIQLRPDLSGVQVEVEMLPGTSALARAGSQFWINRPEISLRGVRGLDTLFSGVTLAVEPGTGPLATRFAGLEYPPLDAMHAGTEYLLESGQRYSIDVGTPLAYRGLPVGRVLELSLAPDSRTVLIRVKVAAPYDRLVREDTVFWNSSGIDMSVGLFSGVRLRDGGVESLLGGAIAFATPNNPAGPAAPLAAFQLADRLNESWLDWAPAIDLAAE